MKHVVKYAGSTNIVTTDDDNAILNARLADGDKLYIVQDGLRRIVNIGKTHSRSQALVKLMFGRVGYHPANGDWLDVRAANVILPRPPKKKAFTLASDYVPEPVELSEEERSQIEARHARQARYWRDYVAERHPGLVPEWEGAITENFGY